MEDRTQDIERLLAKAKAIRLNVDAVKVARHYKWFMRWEQGHITTGQLMGRTGVRFRPKVTAVRRVE